MIAIKYELVNSKAIQVVKKSKRIDLYVHYCLKLMYVFGLRVNEAVEFDKIIHAKSDKYLMLFTKKNNRYRKIRNYSWVNIAIKYMSNARKEKTNASKYDIREYLLRFTELGGMHIGKKRVITHIFRHLYAKRKYQKSKELSKIAKLMGISKNVASNYISSIIMV